VPFLILGHFNDADTVQSKYRVSFGSVNANVHWQGKRNCPLVGQLRSGLLGACLCFCQIRKTGTRPHCANLLKST